MLISVRRCIHFFRRYRYDKECKSIKSDNIACTLFTTCVHNKWKPWTKLNCITCFYIIQNSSCFQFSVLRKIIFSKFSRAKFNFHILSVDRRSDKWELGDTAVVLWRHQNCTLLRCVSYFVGVDFLSWIFNLKYELRCFIYL